MLCMSCSAAQQGAKLLRFALKQLLQENWVALFLWSPVQVDKARLASRNMCGRARCSLAPQQVAAAAGVPPEKWKDKDKYRPTYNLSPGGWAPVVKTAEGGEKEVQSMKWGLVPSFTKPGEKLDHWKMFNARSESIVEKPIFNRLLASRRCVVVLNGFYEWHTEGHKKQPYYVSLDENNEPLYTFSILTTDSSKPLQWLHTRMPVVLADETAEQLWLQSGEKLDAHKLVAQVSTPYGGGLLEWHPVTPEMSKPGFDTPEACKDVRKKKGSISSFFKPVAKEKGRSEAEPAIRNTDENTGTVLAPAEAATGAKQQEDRREHGEGKTLEVSIEAAAKSGHHHDTAGSPGTAPDDSELGKRALPSQGAEEQSCSSKKPKLEQPESQG